ncbi:hypothetical protein L218DRAFT_1044861 [Marasmius fiardii PR-910]|nr:hypothetical protein L218DRAFT_1044861 [Marasmius fiardii PR-910]
MQFQSALTAFVLMATTGLVNGFVVPANQPDGVYTVNEKGEILSSGPLSQTQNVTPRAALGFPVPVEVGCSGNMDPTNTANAVIALEAWCNDGGKVPGGQHAFAVSGGVMAFVCSYGGDNPCNNIEYSWSQQLWEAQCGTRWGQGYVWIPQWAKTYGQGPVGGACTNGAGSGFRVN